MDTKNVPEDYAVRERKKRNIVDGRCIGCRQWLQPILQLQAFGSGRLRV